jgi:2-polyprenyl-3-methyl-5-hydroxy-6-metoxy-1,4-benzoquinol methylase
MNSSGLSIEQVKEGMRAMWMAGDFGVVAKTISKGAEDFVGRLGIPVGSRVLDVATGTGNVAIPLARSGCIVAGVDIATNLLAQARERAKVEGLTITYDEGDAEKLPYPDASFDAVVTMFGAMFAPRPQLVASEVARVLKPGGLLAMANWNAESFTGAMFAVSAKHVPPHPGMVPSLLRGDTTTVRNRLAEDFTAIETKVIPIDFDLPVNPAGAVKFFREYFGPTKVAFSRLDEAGQAAFATDYEKLWASANASLDPSNQTLIHNQYVEVRAIRK